LWTQPNGKELFAEVFGSRKMEEKNLVSDFGVGISAYQSRLVGGQPFK